MENITSKDVVEWFTQQMGKAHKIGRYAQITVEANSFILQAPRVRFTVWLNESQQARDMESIEACFAAIDANPTTEKVKELRLKAAALIAAADSIEAKLDELP